MQNTDPGETWRGSCTRGFLAQPWEASSWSRGVPLLHSPGSRCNQTNGDFIFKGGTLTWANNRYLENAVYAPPLDESEVSNPSNLSHNITNLTIYLVVGGFKRVMCPSSETSPEDGSVFIGWGVTFGPMAHFQFNTEGLRCFQQRF